MENGYKIFDRTYDSSSLFTVKENIEVLKKLKEEICEYQILDCCDPYFINFGLRSSFIGFDCLNWLYDRYASEDDGMVDCLLKISTEDVEWTKERNEGLTGIYYRMILFKPEIQKEISEKIDVYIGQLSVLQKKLEEEEMKRKQELEERKSRWSISEVYRKVLPRGGEDGIDGYIDALYLSKSGDSVRMVSRDVFDAGCWSYPKRLEGKGDTSDWSKWTEEEKSAAEWLAEFGMFRGIRMF